MPIRILPKDEQTKTESQARRERQREYMDKHGPQKPRRKRLTPADTTRRDRDKKIENLHERMGGGEKAKPHSSREGRVASGKNRLDRYRKRAQDIMKPKWPKREPMVPLARGGKPEIGPTLGKGKTAGPRAGKGTKDLRDRLKEITLRTRRPNINESFGGGVKAKPHSTREGRIAAGKRRIKRIFGAATKPKPLPSPGRPSPGRPRPERPRPGRPRPGDESPKWRREERIMTPLRERALRSKKAVGGSVIRKIIRKLKPKPKGKGLGSGIKPSEMREIIPKKDRKLYLQEFANPHKRVKKGQGGSAAQQHYMQHGYGPHKIQLRSGKPKLAKKGW